MGRFVMRRLLQLVPTLFGLSILLFVWPRQLPGGPETALLGDRGTPEQLALIRRSLGLDEPLIVQYGKFLQRLARLDLGTSISTRRTVVTEFLERFPGTAELTVTAMIIAVGLGIPLGFLAARRRGSLFDQLSVGGSLIGISVPIFFLGYVLKAILAEKLGWFPSSGRQDPTIDATHVTNFFVLDGLLTREWDAAADALWHLVLPGLTLASIPLAAIVRITRASVLEVLGADHVRTAEAKGLTDRVLRSRHILRNAMLPVSTTIGLLTGSLLSGAVLTETVFAFAGIGAFLAQAIAELDYPVLMGFILIIALIYVLVNLAVDVSYGLIDPADPGPVSLTKPGRKKVEKIDRLAGLAASGAPPGGDEPGVSLWRDALRRLRRSPAAIAGALIVGGFVVLAVAGPFLVPHDPLSQLWRGEISEARGIFPGPRAGNWLGVDHLGRDEFSRLVVGARQTLLVGVVSTLLGLTAGVLIGGVAGAAAGLGGRAGRWADSVIMRVVDMLLAMPSLLLAVSVAALLGQSLATVMIAIGVVSVPIFARLLRGAMLAQAGSEYVLAATALGVPRWRIAWSHLLPNSAGPVLVQATLTLATAIIEAAALSFLGLGNADAAIPEWGVMLADAQRYLSIRPEWAIYPSVGIIVIALGFTLLGEAMREALDPKLRR